MTHHAKRKDEIKYGAFGHVFLAVVGLSMVGLAAMPARGVTLDTRKVERLASYSEATEAAPMPRRKPVAQLPDVYVLASALEDTNAVKVVRGYPLPIPTIEGARK